MDTVIHLMGHGSRDKDGAGEFMRLVDAVQSAIPDYPVEAGFLEFGGGSVPWIYEVFERCANSGVRTIIAVPVLLLEAGHARKDMPLQVDVARQRYPGIDFRAAPHLGIHPLMVEMLEERIAQTQRGLGPIEPGLTAVLLVGRGTSDIEANADFYKIGRIVWERNKYKWVECCYISLAEPDLHEGIRRCVQLGAKRILAMPYFINTGVLVKRIHEQAAAARLAHPDVEIAVGEHFGVHRNLVSLLVERAMSLLDESGCKRPVVWGRSWRAPEVPHTHAIGAWRNG
jgi:sirohydrochlorin cobaltochelatase